MIVSEKTELVPTREEFYTNYPFYKYWTREHNSILDEPKGLNIYIHIPFCIQICDFCFYMKELMQSKRQVDEYISSLCSEIALTSHRLHLRERPVDSIYIGGGTPSVLTEAQFKKLAQTLYKYHNISNTEFTFEAEPGTFSRSKLQWYKDAGVNRISMGVQSFNDEIIELSSRKHTVKQAVRSINLVKEAGDFTINIDLLSGLAGETTDSWDETLITAFAQPVDMVTIYKMKVYSNTTFFEKGVRKKEIALPSDEEEVSFMQRALDKIEHSEYQLWSTFAFTRSGYAHDYIENSWRGHDVAAYGVSAFGKINNLNYQNANSLTGYQDKISQDELPVNRSFRLTAKDNMVREILLCAARLTSYRKDEFVDKFGFDYFDLIPNVLEQLQEEEYIIPDPKELVLTRKGIIFADFVSQVLASAVKGALGGDGLGFTY